MLIINNEIVADVLTMGDCIRAQEEAFKKIPTGGAIHRPRIDMYMPAERDDGYFRWGTMEGANDGFFAIRMKSDIMYWPENESGNWTEEKYCREPGTYCGVVLLISTNNAEPLAFINDGHIQHMRVGGGAGIGVKHLSRENSHTVGMLGSGGMARTFLEAFCCVRDIRKCKIYSPNKEHRETYAKVMAQRLGIEVIACDNPQEAVAGVERDHRPRQRAQQRIGVDGGGLSARDNQRGRRHAAALSMAPAKKRLICSRTTSRSVAPRAVGIGWESRSVAASRRMRSSRSRTSSG